MLQPGNIVRAGADEMLGRIVGFTHHHSYGRIVMVRHPNGVGVLGYQPHEVHLNNPPPFVKSEPMPDDGLSF